MPPHQFSQSDLVFSGGYFFIFCFKRLTKFELQIIHHGLRSVVCFKIYKIYLFYMGIYSSTFFFILASKRDKRRKKETEKKNMIKLTVSWYAQHTVSAELTRIHKCTCTHRETHMSLPKKCDNNQCGGFIYPVESPCETCLLFKHATSALCLLLWFFFFRPFDIFTRDSYGTSEWSFRMELEINPYICRPHFICGPIFFSANNFFFARWPNIKI